MIKYKLKLSKRIIILLVYLVKGENYVQVFQTTRIRDSN